MRFVKVKDEERTGDVAINLDLIRKHTLEEDCCTSTSNGALPPRTTSPLQVKMHKKYGQPWANADCGEHTAPKPYRGAWQKSDLSGSSSLSRIFESMREEDTGSAYSIH